MKCLVILIVPIPIALWTVVGVAGSAIMGIGYGFVWPVLETFRAISKEGVPIHMKLIRCFTVMFHSVWPRYNYNSWIWWCMIERIYCLWCYLYRMELGAMFGERAPLCGILQISHSTRTSLLWMGCLNRRGRSPLSLSISLCKLGFWCLEIWFW